MENYIKLITLNIESDKHLDLVLPFLEQEKADVVCIQEVFQEDLTLFENTLGAKSYFSVMADIKELNDYGIAPRGLWGTAIFFKEDVIESTRYYYAYNGKDENVPVFRNGEPNSLNRVLSWIKFEKNNRYFTIATTHFTWTGDGNISQEQLRDHKKMQEKLNEIGEVVLCGDFNAPRGQNGIYNLLSQKYKDNVPQNIDTTLDRQYHYGGDVRVVVDYIFTTPMYTVSDVRVIGGISDHKAVVSLMRNIS